MKIRLWLLCSVFSCPSWAESALLKSSIEWIVDALPEKTSFAYEAEGLRFRGCKHREYEVRISQPLSEHFDLDSSIGYLKSKLQWGVFTQKVSMYELAVVPRYHLSERVSVGLGFVAQSQVTFKTTQGQVYDLPRNTEWLASARIQGLAVQHYWEVKVSSQKWQSNKLASESWIDQGLANNNISFLYSGAF